MGAAETSARPSEAYKHLRCTEVWGGNRFVESSVELPGLDAWVYSRPHGGDESGGDVHYVSSCAAGMIARVLVADVAGHGAKVGELAERLRRLMRRHVSDHDQVRLMRSLNREFAAVSTAGRFATAVAFTYDATTGKLIVSNAGHPAPLWYEAGPDLWHYLERRESLLADTPDAAPLDVPFGIEDAVEYRRFEVTLSPGDMVIVYTDSLPEARYPDGRLLGREGLLGVALGFSPSVRPNEFVPWFLSGVTGEIGGPFTDDVTVLAFRPNGHRRHVPLYDRLVAPFRHVWGVVGAYLP